MDETRLVENDAHLGHVEARLDAIEDTLRRIEAALSHPPVEITHTPIRMGGLDARGDQVSWTEQQAPTTWAPRLTPDATPGVVDVDDRAALQRIAQRHTKTADKLANSNAANADHVASMIEGADASNARQPDQHTDYWNDAREAHAAAVDARPESIRTRRKWWLLWLA